MSVKPVVLAWSSYSLRALSMADELGVKASHQYETWLEGLWLTPLRYIIQSWKTWRLLEQERPEAVIVQSPPITAPLVVAIWCRLRGKTSPSGSRAIYVIDAHTGAFHHPRWRWSLPLLRILSRKAAVTLVTDQAALDILQSWKAKGLFLADRLPTLSPPSSTIGSDGEARVAIISSFSDVEPIEEAFAAARLLPHVTFYLTGDPKRASAKLLAQRPQNVTLTGFLRGGNYTALLKNVHGLVILTTEPNDLSCSAYEALVMTKPAVASDGPEMRRFFTRGFIYVINTPEAIAEGIKRMLNEQEVLTTEVIAMRSEAVIKRQPKLEEFKAILQQ